MMWSASVAALTPHQWHGGLSLSMSLRLRMYVADACSVDLRLAGMIVLTRFACATARWRACLRLMVLTLHDGLLSVVSVC